MDRKPIDPIKKMVQTAMGAIVNRSKLAGIYLAVTALLLAAYTNCGAPDHSAKSESSMSGNCDEVLFTQYKQSVYPFFRQQSTCISCHIEGGQGLGLFASPD